MPNRQTGLNKRTGWKKNQKINKRTGPNYYYTVIQTRFSQNSVCRANLTRKWP